MRILRLATTTMWLKSYLLFTITFTLSWFEWSTPISVVGLLQWDCYPFNYQILNSKVRRSSNVFLSARYKFQIMASQKGDSISRRRKRRSGKSDDTTVEANVEEVQMIISSSESTYFMSLIILSKSLQLLRTSLKLSRMVAAHLKIF